MPSPELPPETRAVVPAELRPDAFEAVRVAWAAGCRAHDATFPPLRDALKRLARTARAQQVDVTRVLRTLDAVCRSELGGDARLDWDHVRVWAGGVVIAAYYADD